MRAVISGHAVQSSTGRPPLREWWPALVVVIALWLPVLWRLRVAWALDPELGYGWAVPVLAGYLGWLRWKEPRASRLHEGTTGARRGGKVGAGLIVVATVGVMAMIPVLEVNPLWPRAQWLATGLAAMGTLAVLHRLGGREAVRGGAFAVLFMFTALAWPTAIRQPLVDALTHGHAQFAAEIISWAGYPAVVEGNLILVADGVIGVEEACSGLRSLQAVWMLGWFFGELHRLRWVARGRVLLGAMLAAMVGNVVRTVFLTWQVGRHGGVTDAVHDSAGLLVLGFTLIVVWWYSSWEDARQAERGGAAVGGRRPACVAAAGLGWRTAVALGAAVVAGEMATAAWYAKRAIVGDLPHWRLERPVAGEWEWRGIEPSVTELLLCSSGEHLVKRGKGLDASAVAFVFRWERDTEALSMVTDAHDPTVCMPNIGGQLERRVAPVTVEIDGVGLTFDGYCFRTRGWTQWVFNAVWDAAEGKSVAQAQRSETVGTQRLKRVLSGRKRVDADRVILVLQGEVDEAAAVAWLRAEAPRVLRLD